MEIRALRPPETADAVCLVWGVFLEFEATDCTEKGIQTFRDYIDNKETIKGFKFYGAYDKERLAGVIATRQDGAHITLFFVRGDYQKRGIGRQLFETVWKNCMGSTITVNSSHFAIEAYHKLGFIDTDKEQTVRGMRFTPMRYSKSITR